MSSCMLKWPEYMVSRAKSRLMRDRQRGHKTLHLLPGLLTPPLLLSCYMVCSHLFSLRLQHVSRPLPGSRGLRHRARS